MHKPYFAKYIPQKGEIKDGTNVMFKINNQWTEPCDFDSFLGSQIQEVAQGILCLCSEDIQVDDKVERFKPDKYWGDYHKDLPVRAIKPTEKGSLDNGRSLLILLGGKEADVWGNPAINGNWFYMKEFFKVLAPISEGALDYVKAGDRFTRNDIMVKEWGGSSIRKPIELATITEDSYILIKGPDGKFH